MSPLNNRIFSSSLHIISCLLSLYLGFRFSRLFLYHLSPSSSSSPFPIPHLPKPPPLVGGRHVIFVRPFTHPNPAETLQAHRILSAVQSQQRRLHILPTLPSQPRQFLIVTPTYSRTFQALHLTSLAHSFFILPFPFTWILVEPHTSVNHTSALLAQFPRLQLLRLTYPATMPNTWPQRTRVEAQMRLMALREIRHRRLDGIIVFADESNVHTMEFFDEAQMVKHIASVSVGILVHTGGLEKEIQETERGKKGTSGLGFPVIGPACNSSGHIVGWHSFDTLNYTGKIANFVGEEGLVVPGRFEWAGFVMNSRLVWEESERPDWVHAFNAVVPDGDERGIESPMNLVKDVSFVEPLGRCGKKVLLWWARAEARFDSKFPTRWIIDKPLHITLPSKQDPWPDAPPEIVIPATPTPTLAHQNLTGKQHSKTAKSSRPKHRSRGKRNRQSRVNNL
ncbi:putative beta-1,4-xylosyltransferase IRX14 [Carex rostrata]